MQKTVIFSKKIYKISHLINFFPESDRFCLKPRFKYVSNICSVLGWGLRPTTQKARDYAKKHNLPYVALEDGFLRSLGLGVEGYPPFSLVYDKVGIYYDTTHPSQLENLILAANELTPELHHQAELAIQLIIENRLSKYNHALDFEPESLPNSLVLVIDQTFGDMAVKYGQANERTFAKMLSAAMSENPDSEIWVKTHPDVLAGKKRGYLTAISKQNPRVKLFAQDVNPISLLEKVEKVYCVTSQMGFEALMLGKTVVTFGLPWFAGWGLTDDRHQGVAPLIKQNRRKSRSLIQLFACAYLQYSRYINPLTGESGTIFDVIAYLSKMKAVNRYLSGKIYCVGISWWKKAILKPFFKVPQCKIEFVSFKQLQKRSKTVPHFASARLLVWGKGKEEYVQFAQKHQLPVLRMEDGFIRSVGLGSNLVSPLSLVIDDLGIYFNPQMSSRLEQILQHRIFTDEELSIAKKVQQKLIQQNIGKYNVGQSGFKLAVQGRKTILVPGQVEDDASIAVGTQVIRTNSQLLQTVRERNPDAYIVYKPHPDVVSGNRVGYVSPQQALLWADEWVENADILDCIKQVDEVHTMTSLAGFEALLRGKTVYCYGLPFYAGWGLTQDNLAIARRTRRLTLTELVAGALIDYPLYIDPKNQQFIHIEQAVNILAQQKQQKANDGIKRNWFAIQSGKLKQLSKTFTFNMSFK